jgi:hypothetical protein
MTKTVVKRTRLRKEDFSARGSVCPLCHKEFRGCPHSVKDAKARLEQDLISALVKYEAHHG